MLSQLYIENIAIIQKASIELREGLNVFTGETGAGKTMLISAINAVLGGRTSREIIRSGERRALVSALFTDLPEEVCSMVEELGYEAEDGQLMISRELDTEGRGSCRIGGRPATTGLLRQLAGHLIDVHGQRDSQELLSPDRHLSFIDNFGGIRLEEYQEIFRRLAGVREELEQSRMDESYRLQRQDMLRYQVDEITAAQLSEEEEEELVSQREIIRNAEKITSALGAIYDLLNGTEDQQGLLSSFELLGEELSTASRYLRQLSEYDDRITETGYDLQELSSTVRDCLDQYQFDPRQLDDIENRVDHIQKLKKKYGGEIPDILAYLERISDELEQLDHSDERIASLEEQQRQLEQQAEKMAGELTQRRKKAAAELIRLIQQELTYLDMPHVRLALSCQKKDLALNGADVMELLISANPGEEPKPLSKIASGGELSRVMLAVKNVLADRDDIGTMIFDEIDTGVSGRAAQKIGRKLREVARHRQVLCVTHLAPVAAYGTHHLKICKEIQGDRTYTKVRSLSPEERVEELARITVGENITPKALESAREMLTLAEKEFAGADGV
ncbi:DNA repair protein RecN [Angelakisella massiliensis]|uniref:DNA repair protein RecN n=1 Tax=Angelakisella massiliensis TaxID=1871018 RepID=UPI0008F7F1EB|nr:DNA repair protein RecN [Angelakisella massiliensis]